VRAQVYVVPDQVPVEEGSFADRMKTIAAAHDRLFLLMGDTSASDPEGRVERWLDEQAYRADDRWLEERRLVVYGSGATALEELPTGDSRVRFGEGIELEGVAWSAGGHHPGDVVALSVVWSARQPVAENLKTFVHLLSAEGQLVAQRDSEPVAGRRPTSRWSGGEVIRDRYGVLLPDDLSPGEYRLILGLYDPASGERLPVVSGADSTPADSFVVGSIRVIPR
jgi:hypothetical protein